MMEENDIVIDFKEWNVPTKWEDITLKKYEEIEKYYADKDNDFNAAEVLHILCDKTIDEVNALPLEFTEKIMQHLTFLQTAPDVLEPTNEIEIDGVTYRMHTERQIKTGEFVAVDMVLKTDRHDYASIMAILCRKDGEEYNSKFENEILPDRIELFKKQPITKILPIVSFFLGCWSLSTIPSQLSSAIEEELNRTQKNIETLRKDGRLSRWSTMRLKTKLKKLRKSIGRI